jgi:hypothetical protein
VNRTELRPAGDATPATVAVVAAFLADSPPNVDDRDEVVWWVDVACWVLGQVCRGL